MIKKKALFSNVTVKQRKARLRAISHSELSNEVGLIKSRHGLFDLMR